MIKTIRLNPGWSHFSTHIHLEAKCEDYILPVKIDMPLRTRLLHRQCFISDNILIDLSDQTFSLIRKQDCDHEYIIINEAFEKLYE